MFSNSVRLLLYSFYVFLFFLRAQMDECFFYYNFIKLCEKSFLSSFLLLFLRPFFNLPPFFFRFLFFLFNFKNVFDSTPHKPFQPSTGGLASMTSHRSFKSLAAASTGVGLLSVALISLHCLPAASNVAIASVNCLVHNTVQILVFEVC